MPSTSDPAAPSIKSLEIVRNKNNVAELELRRRLEKYDREQTVSITNLDIEKIDVTDFLKGVKKIHSDDLLESRMWLKTGKDSIARRDIFTAPPGGLRTQPEEVEPEPEVVSEPEEELGDDLLRRLKNTSQITMAIFSKRNMYSSIERKIRRPPWPGMEKRFNEAGQVIRGVKFEDGGAGEGGGSPGGGGGGGGGSRAGTPSLRTGTPNALSKMDNTTSSRTGTPEKPSTAGAAKKSRDQRGERERERSRERGRSNRGRGRDTEREKEREKSRERGVRGGGKGDFMKDLLEANAKRRYKKDKEPPLEDRITDFFTRIVDKKYNAIQELSPDEKKRQWLRLIKGENDLKAKRKSIAQRGKVEDEGKDTEKEGGEAMDRDKRAEKRFGAKSEAAKDDVARGGI